ncbi:Tyrosine-protein kinase hopscotch, partial [Atta colombica]
IFNISPLARHQFALQHYSSLDNKVPNIVYEKHKHELIGLGVSDTYKSINDKDVPNLRAKVLLRVTIERVKYCDIDIGTWKMICRIEDVSTLSIGKNNVVLIGRRTGTPRYAKRKNHRNLTCSTTMMSLHRAIWQVAKSKKLEVMMKILKTEENNYTKEFLELVGKWSQLRSVTLVKVMLEEELPQEIVESEYKKYIPKECIKRFDFFIRKPIHNALTKLSGYDADKDVSNLRTKVLLRITIEQVKYCEIDMDNNLKNNIVLIVKRMDIHCIYIYHCIYILTQILLSFVSALDGYYRVPVKWNFNLCSMLECWGKNNSIARKQPQAIMRDINQILYEVYNVRTHTYVTICPKFFRIADGNNDENDSIYTEESKSNSESQTSLITDYPIIIWNDHISLKGEQLVSYQNQDSNIDELSFYLKTNDKGCNSKDSSQWQRTYEINENLNVTLQRRIGEGFRLNHPNIVKILCSVDRILVMKFIQYGSLLSYLRSHRHSLGFALNIVASMEYVGNMNIVYRDLAARNILLANKNRVKISDFGVVSFMCIYRVGAQLSSKLEGQSQSQRGSVSQPASQPASLPASERTSERTDERVNQQVLVLFSRDHKLRI